MERALEQILMRYNEYAEYIAIFEAEVYGGVPTDFPEIAEESLEHYTRLNEEYDSLLDRLTGGYFDRYSLETETATIYYNAKKQQWFDTKQEESDISRSYTKYRLVDNGYWI